MIRCTTKQRCKAAYSITAKRMISGLVLKYLNGECFVIRRGYETALPRLKLDLSDSAVLSPPLVAMRFANFRSVCC